MIFSVEYLNAKKRNSTAQPDCRELSGDARQWMGRSELALERLPEILRESRRRRRPAVKREWI
mgnify:FL=1